MSQWSAVSSTLYLTKYFQNRSKINLLHIVLACPLLPGLQVVVCGSNFPGSRTLLMELMYTELLRSLAVNGLSVMYVTRVDGNAAGSSLWMV